MAVFPSFKLTKKGEELLNRCIGEGKVLTFTKIKIGNGVPVQDWRELSDIQSSFKEFPVLETSVQKDQVLRIKAYFDNKGFLEDEKFKEIGVFVKLEGLEGEFLYSYTNAGDTGDIIPSESRGFFSRTLDIANYIGYATNITFNIEQTRNDYDFNTEAEVKVATFLKAGDRIRLWGRLVQGDIQVRHGIVTSSSTSLAIDNGLFVQLTGEIVVNTIEDLKNLKGVIEGTVIEVLGYYAKGDGANHKRAIAQADDGSGVQLANNLWANILHSGEVNVSWFGVRKTNTQEENKILLNKMTSNAEIKKIILDTEFNVHEVTIRRPVTIKGIFDNSEDLFIRNELDDKNIFIIDEFRGYKVYFENFRTVGGLNGVFSEYVDFTPSFRNVSFSYAKEAGINHTPHEKYNSNGDSNTFIYTHMENVSLFGNKIGLKIDHSKVPLRQSWSNSNSISKSTINHNKIGIYIEGMNRMEAWKIQDTDITQNRPKQNASVDSYIAELNTNKYGAIYLKNCSGVDIKLDTVYCEYNGDHLSDATQTMLTEIKTNGKIIAENVYEYKGVILTEDNSVITKDRFYAPFVLDSCNRTKIEIENSWVCYFNDVVKCTTGDNCFIMKGQNSLSSYSNYLDITRSIFDVNRDMSILKISLETTRLKSITTNTSYALPLLIPKICIFGDSIINNTSVSKTTNSVELYYFNSDNLFYNFIETSQGVVFLKGTVNMPTNPRGVGRIRKNSVVFDKYSTDECKIILDTTTSDIVNGIMTDKSYITFRNITFKFVGANKARIGQNLKFINCVFDFSNFTGTLEFAGLETVFDNCSYIGLLPRTNFFSIAKNLSTTSFLWNDYRTNDPAHIMFYPEGHGYNGNGINFVRKGGKWVSTVDGLPISVAGLNTPYHTEKMKTEGVYNDFISYMDEKTVFDNQQREKEKAMLLAYEEALKENPSLTFEEFVSTIPTTFRHKRSIEIQEPVPSQALLEFKERYLG